MPSNKFKTRFPPARIKKIMQTDEEVGKIAAPVPVIVSKSVELFTEILLDKSGTIATARGAKTLSIDHIKQCVEQEPQFDFLREIVREAAAKAIGKNGEDGQPGFGPSGNSEGDLEIGSEKVSSQRTKAETASLSVTPGVSASPKSRTSEFSFGTPYSGGSCMEQSSSKVGGKVDRHAPHHGLQGIPAQVSVEPESVHWNHYEKLEDIQPSSSRGAAKTKPVRKEKDAAFTHLKQHGSTSVVAGPSTSSRKTSSTQNPYNFSHDDSHPISPQSTPTSPFLYSPSSVFPVPVMNYPSMVSPSHHGYNPQLMQMMNLMQPQYPPQFYDGSEPGSPISPYYTSDDSQHHREQRMYPSPRDYPGAATVSMPVIRPTPGAQDLSRKRPLDLSESTSSSGFYRSYNGTDGTLGS